MIRKKIIFIVCILSILCLSTVVFLTDVHVKKHQTDHSGMYATLLRIKTCQEYYFDTYGQYISNVDEIPHYLWASEDHALFFEIDRSKDVIQMFTWERGWVAIGITRSSDAFYITSHLEKRVRQLTPEE